MSFTNPTIIVNEEFQLCVLHIGIKIPVHSLSVKHRQVVLSSLFNSMNINKEDNSEMVKQIEQLKSENKKLNLNLDKANDEIKFLRTPEQAPRAKASAPVKTNPFKVLPEDLPRTETVRSLDFSELDFELTSPVHSPSSTDIGEFWEF